MWLENGALEPLCAQLITDPVSRSLPPLRFPGLQHLPGLREASGTGSGPCSWDGLTMWNLSTRGRRHLSSERQGKVARVKWQRCRWRGGRGEERLKHEGFTRSGRKFRPEGDTGAVDWLPAQGWLNHTRTSEKSPCPGDTGLQGPEQKAAEAWVVFQFEKQRARTKAVTERKRQGYRLFGIRLGPAGRITGMTELLRAQSTFTAVRVAACTTLTPARPRSHRLSWSGVTWTEPPAWGSALPGAAD